ncbi:MAG TPA: TonB-dependent receptor [Bryobacteraceae bacterium]|nr:TonB-dependent receptor [Bryobacteraceae bacterium]
MKQRRRMAYVLMLARVWMCAGVWLTLITGLLCAAQDVNTGVVRGTVFTLDSSGAGSAVPGARVSLEGPAFTQQTNADEQGRYSFTGVAPARYRIEATAPGLSGSNTVTVVPGAQADVSIELQIEGMKESVTVNGSAEALITRESSQESIINKSVVLNAPSKDDRVDTLLPLTPGVVRGPDGLINMKGARTSQGGSLVNNANVTDPVTGNAAMNLPIDVVESVKIIANPYDPEYGRLTGAVASLETVTGNFNTFHATVQNLFVRPRKRAGDFVGIESATPRMTVTGPLIKNKIAFTQSFEYRFVRTPISSLPQLQRDMKLEGFNSFSQLDVNLNARQSLTASFALYPQKLNYLGLNTFAPQAATPDLHQRGYMASIQHRDAFGSDALLVSQFSYKRFNADVTANSADPYELLVETTSGGFFDRQSRESARTEWQETYQFGARNLFGSHQFKIGMDYAHSDYDGRVQLLPVSIIGVSNLPIERIDFGPAAQFEIHQNEIAWFLADKWTPFQRLTLDFGLRFDRDSITDSINTAPRAGFALMLTKDAKTVLKGGAGLFYDRVPLNVASFPLLPGRTVSTFAPTGELLSSTGYSNTITTGLRNPRSVGWNVELDRQITSALVIRAGFQQRNTARDFVLTPEASLATLSLSNSGRSFYREFQMTGQYKVRRGTLNASYVRSKAFGNLNDFNQFFGNNAVAVIEPDARGRLPFDAPNRVLAWGQWDAPFKLTVLPVLDVHTGFPHSTIDQAREFIGPRNSQRFPAFTSVDLQVTRPISIPLPHEKFKARVGFSVFNLLNHFNPRDVQNDIDSERFGALFNGVGRTFRGKFILEF